MRIINRVKLVNFKKFGNIDVSLNDTSVFIGDNESGKSTILLAIDLVLGGSRTKIESIGIESLFNKNVINEFQSTAAPRSPASLPEVVVELFMDEMNDDAMNGENNSDRIPSDGVSMIISPNHDYDREIGGIINDGGSSFPFEFYDIKFMTFAGVPYNSYTRPIRHLLIDSTQINSESAMRHYVGTMYSASTDELGRCNLQYQYRKSRSDFQSSMTEKIAEMDGCSFGLKSHGKCTLENDLSLYEDGVALEHKGKGKQSFIKVNYALKRSSSSGKKCVQVVLLEEPENHLSHTRMRELVSKLVNIGNVQVIASTHSSMICSRLSLKNAIMLDVKGTSVVSMKTIGIETAKFFMKAPDSNLLEFVLSDRVILVEGDSEYMLVEKFFQKETGSSLDERGVHVISVGGTCFKRYMDVAKLAGTKTAIIRDNDGDYERNCIENYKEYDCENIKVFSDTDGERRTFEVCMHNDNASVATRILGGALRTRTVLEYMLDEKSESAFRILNSMDSGDDWVIPSYIKEAIEWINA